jgi:hypothetical protein
MGRVGEMGRAGKKHPTCATHPTHATRTRYESHHTPSPNVHSVSGIPTFA